jgi:hypothetical protein
MTVTIDDQITVPRPNVASASVYRASIVERDLVIEAFADREEALLAHVVDVEADRDSYALVAKRAIHALHDVMAERDRLQRRVRQLLDELRHLRGEVVLARAA